MLDMHSCRLSDFIDFGQKIRSISKKSRSLEGVAQAITQTLFEDLADELAQPVVVLTRVFVTRPLGSLPEELRKKALLRLSASQVSEPLNTICLVLLGTSGVQPAWNDREKSVNHAVIPLPDQELLKQIPMIAKLINRLGIDPNAVVLPHRYPIYETESQVYEIFHIEDATDRSAVPDQTEFVIPYGVQSVFGFGGLLPGGSMYAVLVFTRIKISEALAALFSPLSLCVKLSLLEFAVGPIFSGEFYTSDVGQATLHSRMKALETLVNVQESMALRQTLELEKNSQELVRFKFLVDHVNDSMYFLDREGSILYINDTACHRLGYTEAELMALKIFHISPDYSLARFQANFDTVQTGVIPAFETYHHRKDGSFYPVEYLLSGIRFREKGYMLAIVRDITDRKQAEQGRLTQQRLYRAVAEGALDAIVVANAKAEAQLFNPAAQKMFGYSEAEIIGQSVSVLMPEELRGQHVTSLLRYVESRIPTIIGRTIETTARRKNGDRFPVDIALSSVELPEGLILMASIRDLSERQKMQARVSQAEKLASLGLLSAGVAHEINNPLAYVSSNLAVMESYGQNLVQVIQAMQPAQAALAHRPDLTEPLEVLAQEIDLPYICENFTPIISSTRQGVKRIAEIVKKLRGFARLDRAAVEEVDLTEVVSTSLDMVQERMKSRGIEVIREHGPVPPVHCVVPQINQVVLNLLVNAFQAIDEAHPTKPLIIIRTRAEPPWAVIEIEDNGSGVSDLVKTKLFEPFFTTKPIGTGTGLGLAICHGIITDHEGRIEITSGAGQGTTVTVYLPIDGKRSS